MVNTILGLIGTIFYPLFGIIFAVIDLLQYVFSALAGIGTIKYSGKGYWGFKSTEITAGNTGAETDTGLIYYLLTSDLIKNLFMSILILALILIIIFTAMAFIKNAYATKQKTWEEIVGNAFKGLANFIFIPVCCLLGVWLGNILLNAINGATSTGGATAMSRKLFICCAYDANIYRNTNHNLEEAPQRIAAFAELYGLKGYDNVEAGRDAEYYAEIVDQMYAEGGRAGSIGTDAVPIYSHLAVGVGIFDNSGFYNLYQINYLVLIVGGVFMLHVLVSLAYAMIKRMFILLMLYVISPALCAMYPLDEGAAVGNWKKEFIKYTISAYGAVAGMNLFFSILPIVQNLELAAFGGNWTNEVFRLLIMVSGLYVVKEFMGTLSGWIGGDDAMKTGEGLRSSTKKATVGKIGGVVGVFSKAKASHDAGGSFFGSLGRQAWDGAKKSSGIGEIQEKASKSYEEGEKGVLDSAKKQNIRRISREAQQNNPDWLDHAKAAGVEKDVSEVVAQRENAQRIRESRRRGNTGIVPIMTGEQVIEDRKKAKAEEVARKKFTGAITEVDDARADAKARLLATPREFDSIGGFAFVESSFQTRQHIDVQEGMSDAEKQLVVELNSFIDRLRDTDAKLKNTGEKYAEAAKEVSKISTGLVDKNNTAYQVNGEGPADERQIEQAMNSFLENVQETARALDDARSNINLAFTDGVQSLQNFSTATKTHTEAEMRNAAAIDDGTEVIKQATKKK